VELARQLPQALSLWEDFLLARTLVGELPRLPVESFDTEKLCHLVQQAITSRERGRTFSQERLEILGDTVLKYLSTIEVMAKYSIANEAELTERRKQLITNFCLATKATERNLLRLAATEMFKPEKWEPPGDVPVSRGSFFSSRSLSSFLLTLDYLQSTC
jgi:hypothetical protein